MHKPHWYRLTNYLKETDYIKNGTTIPFLFGAYRRLGYKIQSIEDLLNEILASPAPVLPVIEFCNEIKFHVLQLEPHDKVKRDGQMHKDLSIQGIGKHRLVVSYNANLGRDLKAVVKSLQHQYQKHINECNYSWNKGERRWDKFTANEEMLIDHVR